MNLPRSLEVAATDQLNLPDLSCCFCCLRRKQSSPPQGHNSNRSNVGFDVFTQIGKDVVGRRLDHGLELHWMGDRLVGGKDEKNSAIWCMTSRHTRRNAQGEFVTLTNQDLARLEKTNRQQPRQIDTTMGDHANQNDLTAAMALMQQQMQQLQ
ncbi:hypothetical protein DY000_02024743 [Brassica cretica]|uniref:Uncharacterized protein n=1 Tax=Brassica cretica TaxID=69181 RepID=A0ABQ7EHM4_BRACR|nr:hypothetical protein DY000_02024743 [Brassica cretica]